MEARRGGEGRRREERRRDEGSKVSMVLIHVL